MRWICRYFKLFELQYKKIKTKERKSYLQNHESNKYRNSHSNIYIIIIKKKKQLESATAIENIIKIKVHKSYIIKQS